MEVLLAIYRALMKSAHWLGRLMSSFVAGFAVAALVGMGGATLAEGYTVAVIFFLSVAIPLWIAVSIFFYKWLRPNQSEN